ncbi:MAG: 3-dehydroquinate synthase [Candidatus Omnitrophica bacterium]|nr:3-dehydroquinate synthase [Candidatus Omnitrophota bacterium]
MKKIKVNLGTKSYDILIGKRVIKKLPKLIKRLNGTGPVVIFTDKIINSKVMPQVDLLLKGMPNKIIKIVVPASERSKSIKTYQDSITEISAKTKLHKPLVIALGGGVIGDLAGFVAATFRRGVPFIQVPTTLLAQVDSSIGGKVGIDIPQAKNLIGAFYQPKAVLIDIDILRSLPEKQITNGLAEIIKYAVIADRSFFDYLEKNISGIMRLKGDVIEKVVYECAKIKARTVEKDEFDDKDVRIILNFGHTLGHAIEAASGYSKAYNHGESVALGMVLAGEIALRLDMFTKKRLDRIKKLLEKAHLPVEVRALKVEDIMAAYGYDKKFTAGSNRFVLPKKVGSVEIIEDIPALLIKTALKKYIRK